MEFFWALLVVAAFVLMGAIALAQVGTVLHSRYKACHESGHAVVAWVSPDVSCVKFATIVQDPNCGMVGGAVYCLFGMPPADVGRRYWEMLVVDMGGIAAEMMVNRKIKPFGAIFDLAKGSVRAEILIKDHSDLVLPPSPKGCPRIDFHNLWPDLGDGVDDVLNRAFAEATARITARRQDFDRLREDLYLRQFLSEDDMRVYLGPRP